MKYRLGYNYSIESFESYFGTARNGYKWILLDTVNRRGYVITEAMKYVLEMFSEFSELETVYRQIAREMSQDLESIVGIMSPFINVVVGRRFLISNRVKVEGIKSSPDFAIGDSLLGFTIIEMLQVSKKADVYRVKNTYTQKEYVAKCISQTRVGNRRFLRERSRMKQEWSITRLLSELSEYFVKPLEFFDSDCVVLMTEYFESSTLQKYFSVNSQLMDSAVVYSIIIKILEAFAVVHDNGIFHGDIHSLNVLINDRLEIKIIDFGLANHEGFDKDEIINNGGIHFFCPPERIGTSMHSKFLERTSYQSEVYQIALLAYMMLYGHIPFKGLTWGDLAQSIKNNEFDFIPCSSYPSFRVTEELKCTLRTALDKNIENRFKNARELYSAFLATMPNK